MNKKNSSKNSTVIIKQAIFIVWNYYLKSYFNHNLYPLTSHLIFGETLEEIYCQMNAYLNVRCIVFRYRTIRIGFKSK